MKNPKDIEAIKEGATYQVPAYEVGKNGIEDAGISLIEFCKGNKDDAESFNQKGVFSQSLLEVVRRYLTSVNQGELATRETSMAITKIDEALMWLNKRAEDRKARGVQGSYKK